MNANRQSVEIVVPVYNEAATLAPNVERAARVPASRVPVPHRGRRRRQREHRRDAARRGATRGDHAEVRVAAPRPQGPRAARCAPPGSASDADVVSYMDVDLSTNLESFLPLVAPLLSGHSEVAIGTRLAHQRARPPAARSGRCSRAATTCSSSAAFRAALLRRPVRLQGDPRRRRSPPGAARRGRRLVLRHRAAAARRAERAPDPRGARRLDRGPRLARRPRPDDRRRPARALADAPRVLARRGPCRPPPSRSRCRR